MQAAQQNTLALRIAGCSDDYGVALSITGAAPAAVIAIFKTFNGAAATGLAPGVNVPGEAVFRSHRCATLQKWCAVNPIDAMHRCKHVWCIMAAVGPPALPPPRLAGLGRVVGHVADARVPGMKMTQYLVCCRCGVLPLGLLQNQTFFPRTVRADGTGRLTVCTSFAVLVLRAASLLCGNGHNPR